LSKTTLGALLELVFLSEGGAQSQVVAFVENYPVDAVIGVDDDTTVRAAQLAGALRLPHNSVEAVKAARYKDVMRLALGEAWRERGLVFASSIGTPIEPRNVNRRWDELRRKAARDIAHDYHCEPERARLLAAGAGVRLDQELYEVPRPRYLLPGIRHVADVEEHHVPHRVAEMTTGIGVVADVGDAVIRQVGAADSQDLILQGGLDPGEDAVAQDVIELAIAGIDIGDANVRIAEIKRKTGSMDGGARVVGGGPGVENGRLVLRRRPNVAQVAG